MTPGMAIVKREFLSGLRSARPYLFLVFVMFVMIAGLAVMLQDWSDRAVRYNAPIGGRDVRVLFALFSIGLYLSAALLVPPMAAVSICTEKQQDSYDLLRMTYIRPLSLALAKLLNVLGIYGLISIATLPVVGVFFFLVGVDWLQVLQSALIIATAALSCAGIGLLCSAWFYRTVPSVITAYVVAGFFHAGYLLLGAVLLEGLFGGSQFYYNINRYVDEEYLFSICPLAALVMVGEYGLSVPAFLIGLVFHGGLFLVSMGMTLAVLNRPARPMRVQTERPIDDQEVLKARRKNFPYYLLDPLRRRPMIPDGHNPVLYKERQTGLLGRSTLGVRVLYSVTIVGFAVSLYSITVNDFMIHEYGVFTALPLIIDSVIVLFIVPTLLATAMAKEYEWGNMDMLHMTLLAPGQVLSGKFRAALYAAALPVGGAVLGSLPVLLFAYRSPFAWAGFAAALVTMAVCVFYVLCLTLLMTVGCRRSITGLIAAYAAGITALALIPAACIFLGEVIHPNEYRPEEEAAALFTSPFLAQIYNMDTLVDESGGDSHFTLYWLLNTVCFLCISVLLLYLAKARFYFTLSRERR